MVRHSVLLVAIMVASWSLLALTERAFDHQFGITFSTILRAYDDLTDAVARLVEPLIVECIGILRRWFTFPLELHPSWKHVLILLSLYMSNYVSNNVGTRWKNALALSVALFPCAILGAAGFGLTYAENPVGGLAFSIAALVLFAIAATLSTTMFYPLRDRTKWETFQHFWFRTVMPFIVLGAIFLMLALVAQHRLQDVDMESFVLALLAVYVLALAVNLLVRGPAGGGAEGKGIFYWLSGSLGPKLGARIGAVYLWAGLQAGIDQFVLKPLGY